MGIKQCYKIWSCLNSYIVKWLLITYLKKSQSHSSKNKLTLYSIREKKPHHQNDQAMNICILSDAHV